MIRVVYGLHFGWGDGVSMDQIPNGLGLHGILGLVFSQIGGWSCDSSFFVHMDYYGSKQGAHSVKEQEMAVL